MKTTLVVIADDHVGSPAGLFPGANWELEDGNHLMPNDWQLYAVMAIPELQPEEFTHRMFEAAVGCKRSQAERLLEQAVSEGRIRYVGERMTRGKRVKAYRFVKS